MDLVPMRWLPLVPPCDGRGSATLVGEVVPDPSWTGVPGTLQGGMAAALLDEAVGGLSHALDETVTVTGTLELRYRRPVPVDGRPVRVEAWRDRPELRRRNRVHGRLLLADGTVAVECSALMLSTGERIR